MLQAQARTRNTVAGPADSRDALARLATRLINSNGRIYIYVSGQLGPRRLATSV